MGMSNPHDPITALWQGYNAAMNRGDHGTAAEYYDRWEKQCEKLVTAELQAKKIKAAADEPKMKVNPKKDSLRS